MDGQGVDFVQWCDDNYSSRNRLIVIKATFCVVVDGQLK